MTSCRATTKLPRPLPGRRSRFPVSIAEPMARKRGCSKRTISLFFVGPTPKLDASSVMSFSTQVIVAQPLLSVCTRGTACGISRVVAPDENLSSEDVAAATFAWAKEAFTRIDCRTNGEKTRKLEVHNQPILRWSNPAVGHVFGDIFLMTSEGRPAALVSLYAWHRPNVAGRTVEFLSLS